MDLDFCQHDVFQFLFRRGPGPDLIPWHHPVPCSAAGLTYTKEQQLAGASGRSCWPAADPIDRQGLAGAVWICLLTARTLASNPARCELSHWKKQRELFAMAGTHDGTEKLGMCLKVSCRIKAVNNRPTD